MEQTIIKTIIYLAIGFVLLNLFVVLLMIAYQKKIRLKQTQLFKTIIDTEEMERSRIAQSLHDGIGANLSAIKMHFSHLMREEKQNKRVIELTNLINETATEVRQVSHQLMPPLLNEVGLYDSVVTLCNRIKNEYLQIEVILLGSPKIELADNAILMIYRTIQELIVNSIKHGKASTIEVQLVNSKNQLIITVEDNGVGFVSDDITPGIGLKNIQSRIIYLEGKVTTLSKINEGTSTSIYIPKHN